MRKSPSVWQLIKAVLAGFMGVQTHSNYEQDFTEASSVVPYVIAGILFVILLIATILSVVAWIL
ncbi:DUF2970 domain-containing protein [Ningiella sp. W23]|uniref:DUF2970 domain-containing protein n=1 Tax=Ningiella sp. W23 TaxID=3023715 RepID=UPI003757002F